MEKKKIIIEEETQKKSTLETETKQLFWFFVIVGLCFAAFLIPYFYTQSQKTFNYLGLNWDVIKDGKGTTKITFYHTSVPKIYNNTFLGDHNLYLRTDPRKNNIETELDNLKFERNYIATMSPEVLNCSKQNLPAFALGDITLLFPFITNISGATTSKENSKNILYANCENSPVDTTLVQMQMGNETKIFTSPTNPDCYIIQIGSCEENLQSVERFILEILDNFNYKPIENGI